MLRTTKILALGLIPFLLVSASADDWKDNWREYNAYAAYSPDSQCSARLDEIKKKNQDILDILGCSLEPSVDACKIAMGLSSAAAIKHLQNRAAARARDLTTSAACNISAMTLLFPKAFAAVGARCRYDISRLRNLSIQASDELADLAIAQNKALMEAIDDIPNTGSVPKNQVLQASLANSSFQVRIERELIEADPALKKVRNEIEKLKKSGKASKELVEAQKKQLKYLIQESVNGNRGLKSKAAKEAARKLGVIKANSDEFIRMMAFPDAADNPQRMAKAMNNLIDEKLIQGARVNPGSDVGRQARAALGKATQEYDEALKAYRKSIAEYRANPNDTAKRAMDKSEKLFNDTRTTRARMFSSISPANLEGTNMPRELRASFDNVHSVERNLHKIETARLKHTAVQRDLFQMTTATANKVDDATRTLRLFVIADDMAKIPAASDKTAEALKQYAKGISTNINFNDIEIKRAAQQAYSRLPVQQRNGAERMRLNMQNQKIAAAQLARHRSSVMMGKIKSIGVSKVVAGRLVAGVGAMALGPVAMAAEVGIELAAPGTLGCDQLNPFVETDLDGGGWTGSCQPVARIDDDFIAFAQLPEEDLALALKAYPKMCDVVDKLHKEAAPPWKAKCEAGSIRAERDDGLKYQIDLNRDGSPKLVRVNTGKGNRGEGLHAFRINDGEVTSILTGTVVGMQRALTLNIEKNQYREVPASRFFRKNGDPTIYAEHRDALYGNMASVTGMMNCCSGEEPRISDGDCKERFGIEYTPAAKAGRPGTSRSGDQ